jgi:DNA-directed RNA polymerase specialized sigma24 family protein
MGERRDAAFDRARAAESISADNRFRGLLERHEARLRRVAYRMLADPGRVEEVLQAAYALAAAPSEPSDSRAGSYIAYRRACRSSLRALCVDAAASTW